MYWTLLLQSFCLFAEQSVQFIFCLRFWTFLFLPEQFLRYRSFRHFYAACLYLGLCMKFLKQFTIILIVSFIGETLNHLIPLPVPASIYGLVIMFACLKFKIFKLSAVQETGDFLLDIMPLLFVPPSVGFISAIPLMKKYGIQFTVIAVFSTFIVMVVTGLVTQFLMKIMSKKDSEKEGKEK